MKQTDNLRFILKIQQVAVFTHNAIHNFTVVKSTYFLIVNASNTTSNNNSMQYLNTEHNNVSKMFLRTVLIAHLLNHGLCVHLKNCLNYLNRK